MTFKELATKGGETMQDIPKGTMIAMIVAAVVLFGGLGWYLFLRPPDGIDTRPSSKPPQMPPGASAGSGGSYSGTASGMGAVMRGGRGGPGGPGGPVGGPGGPPR
jgi:hypothetical protein